MLSLALDQCQSILVVTHGINPTVLALFTFWLLVLAAVDLDSVNLVVLVVTQRK